MNAYIDACICSLSMQVDISNFTGFSESHKHVKQLVQMVSFLSRSVVPADNVVFWSHLSDLTEPAVLSFCIKLLGNMYILHAV